MRRLSSIQLLPVLLFVLAVSLLVSCKKDDENRTAEIQLLSFGPTGARHGDTLRFIGTNLDKVIEVQFTGENASVKQGEFKQQSYDLILLLVPQSAEKGRVTLKTPQGDIVSKTELNLNVETAATIASVTRQARPGENVTLTGDYLNWVTRVTFNNNLVVSTFVSKTQNQLVVTVPEEAQTGPLVVSFSGTDTVDLQSADTLFVTLPVATSFSPSPVRHNTNVTINGTDLDLARAVLLPGVAKAIPQADFISQSPTQLVVKVDSATVKGKVTLVAASGVNAVSTVDMEVAMPAITALSPNPVAPGADLTINGTNLDVVKSLGFTGVANAVTSFVSKTASRIVVKVPVGAVTGKVTMFILNSGLSTQSTADLSIIGSSVPPIILYDEGLTSAWNGWTGNGWGGTKDVANTEQARSGTKSVKIDYASGAYGVPWQLGGASISLAGYTSLKVSIYGGAGSSGKTVNIGFNEKDGKIVSLTEGKWTDFDIPLKDISTASTLTHLYIKNYSDSGAFTIYVDNLGLY